MQDNIQKIIAVLNDMSMIDEVLHKTFSFAVNYDASVEILYVHESPLFAVPDFFRSDTEESAIDKEKIKAAIEEKIATFQTQKQTVVFVHIDDTENRVWTLAREDKNTLIIAAYHKGITRNIIAKVKQPMLIIKTTTESYKKIAIVIDSLVHGDNCIDSAKRYFPQSEFELFYNYHYILDPNMETSVQNTQIIEESQKAAFDQLKLEHKLKGEFFIDGEFLNSQMSEYLQNNGFDMPYVCSQEDDLFISNSLAFTLLDTLNCDMFVSSR